MGGEGFAPRRDAARRDERTGGCVLGAFFLVTGMMRLGYLDGCDDDVRWTGRFVR